MSDDVRYSGILSELDDQSPVSFEEKILISTPKNRLALAVLHGWTCCEVEPSHLHIHLLDAEMMEHKMRESDFFEARSEVIARISELHLETSVTAFNGRYHYDVYRSLVSKLSSHNVDACSSRLIATALMYLTR
ncbi:MULTISPECIES: hypothetical protein [Brevibacterium]|uniref:hypothetical protein n=1 Tax=Brevibacterium TaxID=1696 RepID=UPI00114C92FC|nr:MULTISPECIES: hypothetical protein [Brevibacterium]MCG7299685.1 hypothetical protein [Brevibacterium ravenspurgense]